MDFLYGLNSKKILGWNIFSYVTHLTKYRANSHDRPKYTPCVKRKIFKLLVYTWNSQTSKLKENNELRVWKPTQTDVRNTGRVDVKMSGSKVKCRRKLSCAGLCNGLNTVRLVQNFATDWTLWSLCRTLQRTEHFAACAGLCNGLNTARFVQDFATDWTMCDLFRTLQRNEHCGMCRTLQRTEHSAACAVLRNGLNTVRLAPLFTVSRPVLSLSLR
jgi:hypothetical protein